MSEAGRCRSASGSRVRQAFADLFRDGMALVEETATYLDGPGRQESKKLDRAAALAYATESMRLTTRLMQLASWLLLHRAVKEGEMSLAQANKEKTKVKLVAGRHARSEQSSTLLPEHLRDLIERSATLQTRCAGSTPPSIRRDVAPTVAVDQSGRAPARAAQGRLRAADSALTRACRKSKKPRASGAFSFPRTCRLTSCRPCFEEARELLLEARQAAAAVQSCCWPPVQAGCDFGSMSRCSVSPSLPQVVRVVNSVPSVMTTLMVW